MDLDMLKDKEEAARVFAFIGYSVAQIADYLCDRFSLPRGVAEATAQEAVDKQAQRTTEDAAKLGKAQAAVEAEHDLGATTWR